MRSTVLIVGLMFALICVVVTTDRHSDEQPVCWTSAGPSNWQDLYVRGGRVGMWQAGPDLLEAERVYGCIAVMRVTADGGQP